MQDRKKILLLARAYFQKEYERADKRASKAMARLRDTHEGDTSPRQRANQRVKWSIESEERDRWMLRIAEINEWMKEI